MTQNKKILNFLKSNNGIQYKCKKAIYSHETVLFFHNLSDRTPLTFMIIVPSGYYSRYLKEELYSLRIIEIKIKY
jgi:hypothetical protein